MKGICLQQMPFFNEHMPPQSLFIDKIYESYVFIDGV